MNPTTSLEASVSLDSLVSLDLKKLTSVLETVFARLKFQEGLIRDNARTTDALQGEIGALARRIQDSEETIASFAHAVEDVNKMNDKVSAWSERFKTLEEQHYELRTSTAASFSEFESRLEAVESASREALAAAVTQVKSAQEQRDLRTQEKIASIVSAQEELKLDVRLSLDRAEKHSSAKIAEIMGLLDPQAPAMPVPVQSSEEKQESAPAILPESNHMKALLVRVRALEMKFDEVMGGVPDIGLESMGLDVDLIHTEIGKDRLIMELQNKLFIIVTVQSRQQANQFAMKLEQTRGNPDPLTPADLQMPRFTKFASIHQRLEDLETLNEQRGKKIVATEEKLEMVAEKVELLQANIREGRGKQQARALARQPTREIPEAEQLLGKTLSVVSRSGLSPEPRLFPEGADDWREEVESLRGYVDTIEEMMEKMRKVVMEKVSHDEMEEIATTIVKRAIKSLPSKIGAVQEGEGKVFELETRLNNYWRNFQEVQTHIHALREITTEMDTRLKHTIDEKVMEVHEAVANSLNSFSHKTDEMQSTLTKLTEEKMTEELLENEQYLRSMVLKLKNDVQKVQAELETIATRKVEAQPIIQEINFDEITEDMESKKLKIVLQQHDQAIRYLANRLTGGGFTTPDESGLLGRSQESAAALQHMEQLRHEMQEILAKHESSKPLSAKDMDLLNEINAALETKISKEELTGKVDRAELVKIYRQLKRKTDQLAEAVKRSETAGFGAGREDVFFSKKRLDAECASCGQLLPENCDLQANMYQPWGRFPSRSNIVGPGFSHILQSIISSPTGSISIPRRFEEGEERSAPTSPLMPHMRIKRRNQVKLPSVR